MRRRLLVIAPDVVGARMAGPGLRFVAIARALAPHVDVTFASGVAGSGVVDFDGSDVTAVEYSSREELEVLVERTDAIFCQFIDTNVARHAVESGTRIIYDFYNALPIETIGAERISGFDTAPDKDREFAELLRYFRFCCITGSLFVTSNERQRDFWLGFMMASGGLIPSTLDARDEKDILPLLPFGMENHEPVRSRAGLRGSHGISEDDFVLIWAGGIWDWFDAETPIRAVAALSQDDPRIKLVFYGTEHPNAVIGRPKAVDRARSLAQELGVLGTQVIFLDAWVPAAERADYLLDADVAVSAHHPSLETRFAFRTRILDHFWARLPSVVSEGDWFAEYIRDEGLGLVVPCSDVDAMADAIGRMASDAALRSATVERIDAVRDGWRWDATTASLVHALTDGWGALQPGRVPADDAGVEMPLVSQRRSAFRERVSGSRLGGAYRSIRRR
ncbi:glycosyltransferase [Leifsonia sp. YIM 134122]|uniref:Glycosyltransferase n=1 Tax=Leifsonia stereocauli TaxID=3134136 RepID=A0ABU9W3H7_9MICO